MNPKLNLILNRIYGVEGSIMSILKSARHIKRHEQLSMGDELKLTRITRSCIDMLGKINDI